MNILNSISLNHRIESINYIKEIKNQTLIKTRLKNSELDETSQLKKNPNVNKNLKFIIPTYIAIFPQLLISDTALAQETIQKRSDGILAPISEGLENILNFLQNGLETFHIPYSYGFSIILLTIIVKTITYPFTKKQVESAMSMQSLKPRINNIKLRYGKDKEKIQRETSILYEEAGIDPTAGCLPTLATIPILWGLFRTLSNVANEGILDTEGFLWIPSLAGPTSLAQRTSGTGTAWLYPFINDAPPIGWHDAICYLILPVALVIAQYISSSIISPVDPNDDEDQKLTKILFYLLPLLIGWFSLNVPSGLSLYYFSNTIITSSQQIWLRKFGGAQIEMKDLGPVTKLGMGRRNGDFITDLSEFINEGFNLENTINTEMKINEKTTDLMVRMRSKRKKNISSNLNNK